MAPPPVSARGSCKHIVHAGAVPCASMSAGRLPCVFGEEVGLRTAEAERSQSSECLAGNLGLFCLAIEKSAFLSMRVT